MAKDGTEAIRGPGPRKVQWSRAALRRASASQTLAPDAPRGAAPGSAGQGRVLEHAHDPRVARATRGWRIDLRLLLLLAWASLVTLALALGWTTARGSIGVRVLVCVGLVALATYLYLLLRAKRSARP